jgi:uncharacterized protein
LATKIGLLAQELSRTNTWWKSSTWWKHDPDLIDAEQLELDYRPDCLAGLEPGGLYILRGPRRVGKTVAIKQTIRALIDAGADPRAIVAASADGWTERDLRTLTQNAALPPVPTGEQRWWFIDEVTAIKGDWPAQVKWLRDNDPSFRSATVVLTGSNARGLSEAVGLLAGRRGPVVRPDRTLFPMGFATAARMLRPDLPVVDPIEIADLGLRRTADRFADVLPYLDDLVNAWEIYLTCGGFPVAIAARRRGRPVPEQFNDALFDVVQRDAFIRSSMSESESIALLNRLVLGLCSPFNISNAAEDIGLTNDTMTRRVRDLLDAYLVWTCPQADDTSWIPRHGSMSKLYFIDPLQAHLANHRNAAYAAPDPTALVEQQIGMALRRRLDASAPGRWAEHDQILHVRTRTRKEIDFVGPELGRVAIESKYTESGSWRGEAATVVASKYFGIVTTRNVLDLGRSDVWAVPAALLAYLIDT